MRRKAKTMVPPLQQAEFDALPYSVQRKYFSSLERLQIRQHSLDEQNAHVSGASSRTSSSGHLHPSSTLASLQHHCSTPPLGQPHLDQLSKPEIDFFLALPDKVRKLYFSREEQVLLQSSCAHSHLAQHNDFERARQRFSDFKFGFPQDQDSTSEHRGRSRRRSSSESSLVSPRQASPEVTPQEEEKVAEHCNNKTLPFQWDTMSPPIPKSSSPSHDVRRTMSLSHQPVRHYTTPSAMILGAPSAVLMADPPLYSMPPSAKHQRAHSSSLSIAGRRSLQTPSLPVIDTEARHYQDPEARKKLRMYLASPQKFDEAIEFGFPSTTEQDTATPHFQLPPITSHSRKFSRDMQTFLKDGKLSFFEEPVSDNLGLESDEEASVPDDSESPVTPSSSGVNIGLHSRHVSHSKLSTDGAPCFPNLLGAGANPNREMTLRMTLTRPDLRADEEQLYGWQSPPPKTSRDDPLALEDLVFTDDMTGTKGAFYVKPKPRGNLVSRMLKRASLKAR